MKRFILISVLALVLAGCGHTETDLQNAYEEGREAGYNKGYTEGFDKGKEEGYQEGYNAGVLEVNFE